MTKLVATVIAVVLLSAPRSAESQETITARAKLNDAIAEAKKWQADAVLWSVSAAEARPDGSAVAWTYNFQSEKAKSCYRVVALPSRNITTTLGRCRYDPISNDFIDSPAALKSAIAGGFKPGESINLGLAHRDDRNLPAPRECWSAFSPESDFDRERAVMRSWCVDPKTGKFVTQLAGEKARGKKK